MPVEPTAAPHVVFVVVHGVGNPATGQVASSVAGPLLDHGADLGPFERSNLPVTYRNAPNAGHVESHEAVRLSATTGAGQKVDVVEVHWADLSTARPGALGALRDLHELIVFLPDAGTRALDELAPIVSDSRIAFGRRCHVAAGWFVAPLAPLLAYVALAAATQFLTMHWVAQNAKQARWLLDAVVGLGLLAVLRTVPALISPRRWPRARAVDDIVGPLLAVLVAGALTWWVHASAHRDARMFALSALGYLALAALGARLVVPELATRRTHVMRTYLALSALPPLLTLAFAASSARWYPSDVSPGAEALLGSSLLGALMMLAIAAGLVWSTKVALQTISLVALLLGWLRVPSEERGVVSRAALAAAVSLGVSSWLFMTLTIGALWAMLAAGRDQLDAIDVEIPPLPGVTDTERGWHLLSQHLEQLVTLAGTPMAIYGSALAALGLLLAALAMAPVALAESSLGSQKLASRQYDIVTSAFRRLYVPALLVIVTTTLLNGLALAWTFGQTVHAALHPSAAPVALDTHVLLVDLLRSLIGLIVGGSAGLVALRDRVGDMLPRLAPGLDIVFDVERYVRTARPGAAPLRDCLLARTEAIVTAAAENADLIVLVAHSQGTVIAADYLRARDATSLAAKKQTKLLTFGSPLGSAYAWMFPSAYRWVGRKGARPGPLALGTTIWVNRWFDGDYVGREIARKRSKRVDEDGQPFEASLGAGGHMGYWSSPEIARTILRLGGLARR